jgi:hypothetical protein
MHAVDVPSFKGMYLNGAIQIERSLKKDKDPEKGYKILLV